MTGRPRHGTFVLLRRLRVPLVILVLVYAVSVLGFTLVEGVLPDGRSWRMSFLHAFYFVSFLGTTIGLGEIPHPFSDAQRLWATASIYATVLAWLYGIGALFAVLQDPLLRRLWHESRVERLVRGLREPFYLVCGYGETGHRVTRELTEDGTRVVVVDADADRVDAVDFDEHPLHVPALAADASDPGALAIAGLTSRWCAGVLALTGSDATNAKVALTARLLSPALPVHCVARAHEWHPRMAAAGASRIINPFDTFADRVGISIRTPSLHVIYEALTTQAGTAGAPAQELPRGRWVVCGWGPFARALRRQLEALGIAVAVVAPESGEGGGPPIDIGGDPTDPAVLKRAHVDQADTLVAATAEDVDNLAIVLAARALNPRLFVMAHQTQRRNSAVFGAAPADLVMLSSYVVAAEVLRDLRAPLLSAFLRRARDQDEDWAGALLQALRTSVGDEVLESWTIAAEPAQLPAVARALARGERVTLRRLVTRVDGSGRLLRAVPLMLERGPDRLLLPGLDAPLQPGDRILFCGRALARSRMRGLALARTLAPAAANEAPLPAVQPGT